MAQQQRISKNNTAVYFSGNVQCVALHATEIIRHNPQTRHVQFDTGGYFTATTKTRMNQAMNQWGIPLHVSQESGEWFVHNRQTNDKVKFMGTVCIVKY